MFQFKGGRYGLAMELKRRTPALRNMRLGDVCHLVQLAINRGILCYEKSVLQPVASCLNRTQAFLRGNYSSFEKLLAFYNSLPAGKLCARPPEPPATPPRPAPHEDVRVPDTPGASAGTISLKQVATLTAHILDSKPCGSELAEVARGLESKFKLKLHPEAFGVTKMIDLFLLPEMQRIFRLFCTAKTRHKVIIQLKKHKVPDWARAIQRKKKLTTDPLAEDIWNARCLMSSISMAHARCFSTPLYSLSAASSTHGEDPGTPLTPRASRHASAALDYLSSPKCASTCIGKLDAVLQSPALASTEASFSPPSASCLSPPSTSTARDADVLVDVGHFIPRFDSPSLPRPGYNSGQFVIDGMRRAEVKSCGRASQLHQSPSSEGLWRYDVEGIEDESPVALRCVIGGCKPGSGIARTACSCSDDRGPVAVALQPAREAAVACADRVLTPRPAHVRLGAVLH
eukprot:Polyplicarium_translucidae@DN1697_c0_g1_i1.p1